MNKRVLGIALIALIVMAAPYFNEPTSCGSLGSSASSAEAQAQGSENPSSGCGSQTHPMQSLTVNCSACGIALLADQFFLPDEMVWKSWNSASASATPTLPSTYWHPPA